LRKNAVTYGDKNAEKNYFLRAVMPIVWGAGIAFVWIKILNNIFHIIYRVSQEECARLREGVPYVKVYRYNPKHPCPKLNVYGDNDQRSLKL